MSVFQCMTSQHQDFLFVEPRLEIVSTKKKEVMTTFVDYTSYFANVKNLPDGVVPISICGKAPVSWKGLQFKKLAPKAWFFKQWKENGDNEFYIRNFQKEVLDELDPDKTWSELRELSGYLPFALICYEKPNDFCHRHLVAEWFNSNGYFIKEF